VQLLDASSYGVRVAVGVRRYERAKRVSADGDLRSPVPARPVLGKLLGQKGRGLPTSRLLLFCSVLRVGLEGQGFPRAHATLGVHRCGRRHGAVGADWFDLPRAHAALGVCRRGRRHDVVGADSVRPRRAPGACARRSSAHGLVLPRAHATLCVHRRVVIFLRTYYPCCALPRPQEVPR
jgi:hypothetical protein